MAEAEYKKELFEFKDKPKKNFFSLRGILPFGNMPKGDFENKFLITITPERLVFIAIGIVMLMVIIFALGVERGKGIGRAAVEKVMITAALPAPAALPVPVKTTAVKAPPPPAQDAAKPFTIIAVTLTRKDTAAAEAGRLKREGFAPFVYQSGSYYQVCVGAYANKAGALIPLKKVRQIYKDAYLKLR